MELASTALTAINMKLSIWWELLASKLPNMALAILVFFIFYYLSKWVVKIVPKLFSKAQANEAVISLVESTVGILVIGIGAFFALGVVGLDKTVLSLMAGVGVIGLALGFAFQDIATNLMSGVFIALQGPFNIGHLIKVGDLMGFVEDIRLRDTIVRNFSGQRVHVPNKSFNGSNLINYSTTGERRLEISVGISYKDDIKTAMQILSQSITSVNGRKKNSPVDVFIAGFGDSSVNLQVWFWIDYPGGDYVAVHNEAMLAIKDGFDNAGINIPFPIRTLDFAPDLQTSLIKSLS